MEESQATSADTEELGQIRETDILTEAGKTFEKKGACVIAITKKKLQKTHEPVRVQNGYVGRRVDMTPPEPAKLEYNYRVRVTRTNTDPDNAGAPVSVTVNDRKHKRIFNPGAEVMLSKSHVDVLRASTEETRLEIPPDSGIYQASDPLTVARNQFPEMNPEWDRVSGLITMVSRRPNYIVEVLEGPNG